MLQGSIPGLKLTLRFYGCYFNLVISLTALEFRCRLRAGIEVEWVTFRHTHAASVENWTRVESLCSCDHDIAIPNVKVECRMPVLEA
jgi:hypothetical protein